MIMTLETKSERLEILDVLKGIAIIMVVITHCAWTEQQRKQYYFPFWIDMAVPIFMLITGYLYSRSFYKRKKILDKKWIERTIIRYTVPFLGVFISECVGYSFFKYVGIPEAQSFNVKNAVIALIKYGGYGPGSYYYACLLQIVFFFPLIYWIINRMKEKGLLICFLVNFSYEIIKTLVCMSPDIYRMIALRYWFALALGAYLFVTYQNGRQLSNMFYLGNAGIGLLFLLISNQYIGNWSPKILNQWTNTSLIAIMFILPVVGGAIRGKKKIKKLGILNKIGKVSYDIFLVQMAYYNFGANVILYGVFHNTFIVCLINVLTCIIVGSIYARFEGMIVNKLQHN